MSSCRALVGCLLLIFASTVQAAALRYRVEGVSDSQRENVRAFLGESPADEAAAERFLLTAVTRTELALEALGHYTPTIDLRVDRRASPWQARLNIEAGEAVRYTTVEATLLGPGREDAALRELWEALIPAPGDTVHHGAHQRLREQLLRRARERGYFEAGFTRSEVRVDAVAGTAAAELEFSTGARARFGPVQAPQDAIRPGLLASIQPFAEGDPYAQEQLLALRANLLRLGFFSSVVVVPDLAARTGNSIPVRVDLQLAPRHSYEVGVGFSTDTRQRVSLVWSSPRLNSRGHSQQTRLRYSPINPSLLTLYSVPLDDLSTDLLQFGARFENNEFGDLDSEQRELLVRREISRDTRVRSYSVRALAEAWSALGEDFDARYVLAGLSFSDRQRRGSAVDPSAGLSQYYDLEIGSSALGSDQDLLRVQGTVSGLRRFGQRSRVVARLTAGLVYSSSTRADELPPSLAFFAGGDNSIRGYAYQSIGREVGASVLDASPPRASSVPLVVGGNRLLTASVEYQHYVRENWRLSLFADGGDAFNESDFELNVGVGVGVHYLTPLGAVRVEVANPITEDAGDWRLHINIGAEL